MNKFTFINYNTFYLLIYCPAIFRRLLTYIIMYLYFIFHFPLFFFFFLNLNNTHINMLQSLPPSQCTVYKKTLSYSLEMRMRWYDDGGHAMSSRCDVGRRVHRLWGWWRRARERYTHTACLNISAFYKHLWRLNDKVHNILFDSKTY